MPKKAHGRPARSKSRQRRPVNRVAASSGNVVTDEVENGVVEAPAATLGAFAVAPRTAPAVPARRNAARRAPVTTINYNYLRHDIRLLGILALAMVILVLLAFFLIPH